MYVQLNVYVQLTVLYNTVMGIGMQLSAIWLKVWQDYIGGRGLFLVSCL